MNDRNSTVSTVPKQLTPWKPGQSGNPAGRPKGSRNKLGEEFVTDLYDHWQANGKAVIEQVARERPADYLKVVASILPKEVHIKDQTLEEMSEDDLIEFLASVRSATALIRRKARGKGVGEEAGNPPSGEQFN